MSNPNSQYVEAGEIVGTVKIDVVGMKASMDDRRPPLIPLGSSAQAFDVFENQILIYSDEQDTPSEVNTGMLYPRVRSAANGTGHEIVQRVGLTPEARLRMLMRNYKFAGIAKNGRAFDEASLGDNLLAISMQRNVMLPCLDTTAPGDRVRVVADVDHRFPSPAGRVNFVLERCSRESFSAQILSAVAAHNVDPTKGVGADHMNAFVQRNDVYVSLAALQGIYWALEEGFLVVSSKANAALLTAKDAGDDRHTPTQTADFIQRLAVLCGLVDGENVFTEAQRAGLDVSRGNALKWRSKVVASTALTRNDVNSFFGTVNGSNSIAIDPNIKKPRRNPAGRILNLQFNALPEFVSSYYDAHEEYHAAEVGTVKQPAGAVGYPLVSVKAA